MMSLNYRITDGSYSVSDIQYLLECIIKKHEAFTIISPIYIHINRIDNRSAFKIKD